MLFLSLDEQISGDMSRVCLNYNLRRVKLLNLSFVGSNLEITENPGAVCSPNSNIHTKYIRAAPDQLENFQIHVQIYRKCSTNTKL